MLDDNEVMKLILNMRHTTKADKLKLHNIIIDGINSNKISLTDKNITKFDITSRTLNSVRMYKEDDVLKDRRFKQFNKNFKSSTNYAQSGDETQYAIDFAKDKYEFNGCINNPNTAWITFRV